MTAAPKPTFVFVPGAWHRAETWDKVIAALAANYKSIAITLPSTVGNPLTTFGDDVKEVQKVIRSQTSQGLDVIIVAHSYGGQVGNSAVKGFAHDSPELSDGNGRVIGLALMATGFTQTGKAFLDGLGGKPPPQWVMNEQTGFADIVVDARDMMYHDLPEDEGNLWVSKLTKQALPSLTGGAEFAYAGWKDVPSWYLITLEDHALPAQVQRYLLGLAESEKADVTGREIETSHSPILSKPHETASFLIQAAEAFVEKKSQP